MAGVQTRWRYLLEDGLAGGHHGVVAMVINGRGGRDFIAALLAVADAWAEKKIGHISVKGSHLSGISLTCLITHLLRSFPRAPPF